ncbi:MAG: hypothetical protein HY708_08405 [Ignavibacteriae bacterium]|nr:hypothetical protein [Ignavibacteriota bacterium]
MENKLRQLYALQQIDTNLDELEEMKGDLPTQVRELDGKATELQRKLEEHEHTMKSAFSMRDNIDTEILSLKEKSERYQAQQYEVRTNREYDALTREMEHAAVTITRLEKEMETLESKATIARTEIETTKSELEEINKQLEQKRTELAEVSKANEDEELKYRHERENVVVRISKSDLGTYERIRKAKNGKAVVPVKRGACGGCFTKVPPQKLLELRQNKKVYTCERCGRILVSDEIVEKSSTEV